MEEFEENVEPQKWQSKKYFYRQLLVSTGAWTCYFLLGLSFGAPTVFIPQLRAEANSTDTISENVASWIPTVLVYAGVPWTCLLPIFMRVMGRKYTLMLVSVSNLISYIVLYYSTTITQIIISEFINGINTGSHFTVAAMIVNEYTSPKHRGFFLTAKTANLFWGILISNTIGTFFHWKNIAVVGIACSIYLIILSFIFPESPYWLNMKHRIKKCSKTHRWLKGIDKNSEKELEQLIMFQRNIDSRAEKTNLVLKDFLVENVKIVTKKQFYKPLCISLLVQALYVFSGKIVFSVYALDIMRKITQGKEFSAYAAMLILDGVTVACMYIGCIFARMIARRKLLISTTLVGILFLISLSVHTYLIKISVLPANNYISMALMIAYSIGIACGPTILAPTISGELVSVEFQGLLSCFTDLSLKIMLGSTVKISPYLFKSCGSEGAFLFYGVISSIILFFLYKFLPETKDKTLQEITEAINGTNKVDFLSEEDHFLRDSQKITEPR